MPCSSAPLLMVDDTLRIEERSGSVQIDFANALIGGGVLRDGCVQEEIRMLISPELLCSLLLAERLADDECLLMSGSRRFSAYAGYASSFRFTGDWLANDDEECQVCAMDALMFPWLYKSMEEPLYRLSNLNLQSLLMQYQPEALDRELRKARCAFQLPPNESAKRPIATGNWGCGAFGGDLQLKAIIQLLAAAGEGRSVEYLTFGQAKLFAGDSFGNSLQVLWCQLGDWPIGTVYRWLQDYRQAILEPLLRNSTDNQEDICTLFDFLLQRSSQKSIQ